MTQESQRFKGSQGISGSQFLTEIEEINSELDFIEERKKNLEKRF